MHIAIDARILTTTTGRYAAGLLRELEKKDKQNRYSVLLDRTGFAHWNETPHAANFKPVQADFSMYGLDGQVGLARLLKKLNPDLVHYTFQQTSLLYRGKFTVMLHDLTQLRFKNIKPGQNEKIFAIKMRILKVGFDFMVKRAERILTGAEFIKDDIAKTMKVPLEKIVVTKEAGDLPKNIEPKEVSRLKGKKFILYVGNAHSHKNLDRMVEAYKMAYEKDPSLSLAIVGKVDVFHEQIIAKIRDLGLKAAHHLGFVSDEELVWLYKNARAYVFPALSEGFGLPGLEAMGYGCPVVSSNATCLPEIYGEAAHYFDPYDCEDMAKKILEVVNGQVLRQKLILAGNKQVKKYSWEKCAEETLAVFKEVLGQK